MKKVILYLLVLCVVSCADRGLYGDNDRGAAMVFTGEFDVFSKATLPAFEADDQLGVYVVSENQQLNPTNNRINNVCFKVDQNGNIKSDPTVYYPDAKQTVTFHAYYPYQTTITDATKLSFAVETDQTTAQNIKKSDLCYSKQGATPSDNPQTLQFSHLLSKIVLNIETGSNIKSIESVRLLAAITDAKINLSNGALTASTTRAQIDMSVNGQEAIIVPQTFAANAKMLAVDVKLIDDKLETYYLTPLTPLTTESSKITTLKLTLNDSKTVTLGDAPQITKWTTGATSGGLGEGVSNNITIHWAPAPDRGVEVDSIILTIKNVRRNTIKEYGIRKSELTNQSPQFLFTFKDADLSYPYSVLGVRLSSKGGVLQDCDELTSASIYKAGDYNLGAKARVESIKIGDVWWATGNLVATSSVAQGADQGTGVRIGKPTDGGLYFQFGSLIGWKGGNLASGGTGSGIPDGHLVDVNDGKYWNNSAFSWANDAQIWPSKFTNGASGINSTWPKGRTDNLYYFGSSSAPYDNMGQKLSDYANWESGKMMSTTVAVGDPCRYYLGNQWRQPTAEDWGNLFKNVYANNGKVGGAWAGAGIYCGYNHDATPINGKRSNSIPSLTYDGANINSPDTGRGIYVNTSVTTPPATAPDANTLFFPASGYRHGSTGSFSAVGRTGYSWSGSVYNAPYGFHLYFNTTYVYPQGANPRSLGFPVRCVRGLSIGSDVEMNMLTSEARTVNLSFSGTSGERWTLTETGDKDNAFTPSATSGTASNVTVAVAANKTGAMRSVTYRLTSDKDPDLEATITLNQDPEYISVGGVRWATGSLIANGANSAKVGNRYDYGLTFQFGSLVGWNPTTTAAVAVAVKPTGYTGGTTWTNVGYYKDGTIGTIPATDAPATGIGDACRYYLGGKWRTPTRAEYKALFNNAANNSNWATVGGSWQGSPAGGNIKGLFFPAAGYRYASDGSLSNVGVSGNGWSASVYNATNGYSLYFTDSNVLPESNGNRSNGLPVRCVSGVSLLASSESVGAAATSVVLNIVGTQGGAWKLEEVSDAGNGFTATTTSGTATSTTINVATNTASVEREATYKLTLTSDPDLYTTITIRQAPVNSIPVNNIFWATGNLIANGANGVKIGAPTDYGLTFQFGSLVGWNPTTTATVAIAVKPTGYTGGTAWTNVGRYTGGTTANEILPVTDAPATGIGDPCRYYLGGKWRLPTAAEYLALIGADGANTNKSIPLKVNNYALSFPTAGCRNYSDGSLYYVGSNGSYWSASVANATNGYTLYFTSSNVYPQGGNNRTYGFPVRCVSAP